jgi:dTDP-L-rhamnose 4-epimerase
MTNRYLIIGGAGFIGSHLADRLLEEGDQVRIFDSLETQVHGEGDRWPDYLNPDVECVHGDLGDKAALIRALDQVDGVFHLAAAVGVGQSMYQIERYTAVNELGTATLLEALAASPVQRLVVASSMSVYGEGLYRGTDGGQLAPPLRSPAQLAARRWEIVDGDGLPLEPIATPEDKRLDPASVYALGKYVQERMCLVVGQAYGMEVAALRLFNVFGPRQALSNPYTGVLAIFASRLMNGHACLLFEDGEQQRDFVHVRDVANAFHLAMTMPGAAGKVMNIGSGRHYTIIEIARLLGAAYGRPDLAPVLLRKSRAGDIRHCFADTTLAERVLDYAPAKPLENSLDELLSWVERQKARDSVMEAQQELERRGLVA